MNKSLIIASAVALVSLSSAAQAEAAEKDVIAKGAYLARAGDCTACHTSSSNKPFAGGMGLESPMGTIYTTNITPDKETGIGNWTEKQFAEAVREGIRADGTHLYPAMPYPSYAKVSDDDIHALYEYFMHSVKPVSHKTPETDLSFPYSQRWGMALWNFAFADDSRFKPAASNSDEINRGAYLVQGLGHCGSCHTPRGIGMQEDALDDTDDSYLSGAYLNDWLAPSLRGKGESQAGVQSWAAQDIVDYLKTGRNIHTVVSGEMSSVVEHSTSHLNDADLNAVAAYLKSLPAQDSDKLTRTESKIDATAQALTKATNLSEGQRLYLDNCSACHLVDGQGSERVFPAIDRNSLTNADNPTGLIHTILEGSVMPATKTMPSRLAMPGFAWRLSDQQVADLATFVRQGWNNQAGKVTAEQVAAVRAELKKSSFKNQPDVLANAPELK